MIELMSSMSEFNEVRFSAYRTAMKLRTVQKRMSREYCYYYYYNLSKNTKKKILYNFLF